MSHDAIPKYLSEGLEKQSPETLRIIAQVAEELAEQKEAKLEAELESDEIEEEDRPDDEDLERDEAPSGATLTIKEINDNEYYYWQWRDGDKIKSEYVRPVNPSE